MSTRQQPNALATLNDIFFLAVERNADCVMVHKQAGLWTEISSREFYQRTVAIARALQSWGIAKGDRVAILSENRPEWQMADFACLLLGAMDVPVYATLTPEQIAYMLQDSGARAIFVSTPQQLNKIQQIQSQTAIERIIVMDEVADSCADSSTKIFSFHKLLAEFAPEQRYASLEARARAVQPSDPATIVYTSGTTGRSKGALLTHGNLASNISYSLREFPFKEDDLLLSFLPLSHITARTLDYSMLFRGVPIAYCPYMEELPDALKEMRPTILVSVPRVYEKVYNRVQQEVASGIKRKVYHWAVGVGQAQMGLTLAGLEHGGLRWRVADALLFSKIRAGFGGRARSFISGGAPLGRELATWFAQIGILILEGYGLTETSPVIAVNTPAANRIGTVGKVLPNVEAKIADDGELLVRGPSIFQGYWNLPDETRNAFADGWFKTGDIASLDADGFLSITDRKKDLIKTSGGKFIAPQPLEAALKTNAFISQAVVIGDRRKFPAVIIAPQFPALEDWARVNEVAFSSRTDLVRIPKVQALYEGVADALNQKLAKFEKLKKVLLVPDEFSIASGELTPSLKLKRRVVEEKYRAEIEQLYVEEGSG